MSSTPDDDYDAAADAAGSYFAAIEAKRLRGDTHWPPPARPDWRIVTPAPRIAALDLAGGRARVRRLVLGQVRNAESFAIYRGDAVMAVAMFGRHGWRRTELALALAPAAAAHMGRLIRFARLTLPRIGQDRLIVALVHPAHTAGQRMAMLCGFRPARLTRPGHWIWRRQGDGVSLGRFDGGGAQGAGTAADRQ